MLGNRGAGRGKLGLHALHAPRPDGRRAAASAPDLGCAGCLGAESRAVFAPLALLCWRRRRFCTHGLRRFTLAAAESKQVSRGGEGYTRRVVSLSRVGPALVGPPVARRLVCDPGPLLLGQFPPRSLRAFGALPSIHEAGHLVRRSAKMMHAGPTRCCGSTEHRLRLSHALAHLVRFRLSY